jgi:inositol oxygenase
MEYNLLVREKFKTTVHARMGIWEAMEKLNELIDDSDPDVCLVTQSTLIPLKLISSS